MKLRFCVLALALACVTTLVLAPVTPAAPGGRSSSGSITTQVTGTATDVGGTVGTLTGVLTITGFDVVNGQLAAVGTLTGTVTDALGNIIASVTQAVTIPLQVSGSCTILHLDLGPISLNVLGLQVTTNEIIVDITAVSGPGNLVGNLLCAVTHLLDNPSGTLAGITNLLNTILGLL
jgi:hypothetical protein